MDSYDDYDGSFIALRREHDNDRMGGSKEYKFITAEQVLFAILL
jgi:hypothetical protein